MEKTRKDYEREEEKKKDKRVLMVMIPIILVFLFCQWLFKSDVRDISKVYEAFMVEDDGVTGQKVTVELDGTATYASMFSDELESYGCDVVVKDSSGIILFETYSRLDSIGYDADWIIAFLTDFDEESNMVEYPGEFRTDALFEKILLTMDDGTYISMPAGNLEEAKSVYTDRITFKN